MRVKGGKKLYKIEFFVEKEGTELEAKQQILDEMLEKGITEFKIERVKEPRTEKQNKALHLWFEQMAEVLNSKGIPAYKIFKEPVEHFWTPEIIKEMWRKIQKAMFGKKSTTELFKTGEIGRIYDVFNKIVAERTKGEVKCPPFPSMEEMGSKDY